MVDMTSQAAQYSPEELKIKDKLENLLQIRRRYLNAASKTQDLKAAGNQAFEALETEIRASLQPLKPAKRQAKKKTAKD
jgi:plasmid maintenance system killer protein